MILPRRRLLQSAPAAALAACGSAPPARYWRLAPLSGGTFATPAWSVQVRNIGLPGYLQQNSGILLPSGQYQIAAAANDLWAAPLAPMLQSVLVQDLSQRLPQTTVTASSGMVGIPADILVELDVLRFDPDGSGRITLRAQLGLKDAANNRFLATRLLEYASASAVPIAGAPGTARDLTGLVATMSALWAALADAIARLIARTDLPAPDVSEPDGSSG